jgi:hypothetical protein
MTPPCSSQVAAIRQLKQQKSSATLWFTEALPLHVGHQPFWNVLHVVKGLVHGQLASLERWPLQTQVGFGRTNLRRNQKVFR